jgi:hypothetical protein
VDFLYFRRDPAVDIRLGAADDGLIGKIDIAPPLA